MFLGGAWMLLGVVGSFGCHCMLLGVVGLFWLQLYTSGCSWILVLVGHFWTSAVGELPLSAGLRVN